MTTANIRPTAKIYTFASKASLVSPTFTLRAGLPATVTALRPKPLVSSANWYHEAAIADAQTANKA